MTHKIIQSLEPLAAPIGELSPDPANARTGHDIDGIAASLRQFGQRKPVVANKRTGIVIAGNGTLAAAKSLGWTHIAVSWVDDDPVTATAYGIADNRLGDLSRFDDDALRALLESLPDGYEVPGIDAGFFDEISKHEGEEENYKREIVSPVYEITTEKKPDIKELIDDGKYRKLVNEINSCNDISEDDKRLLLAAATRHIVFNYQNVAEYYAHSPKQVQELMENSALVVIDFNKAIELGFLTLTQSIADAYDEDYPTEG